MKIYLLTWNNSVGTEIASFSAAFEKPPTLSRLITLSNLTKTPVDDGDTITIELIGDSDANP